MPGIPDALKEHLNQFLLGRLKLKLYKIISNREDYLPEESEIRRYIFQQYRLNPQLGHLFSFILLSTYTKVATYNEAEKPPNVKAMLSILEERPLERPFFLELNQCPEPWPEAIEVCVYCEELADSGYVYILTLFDESKFPEQAIGRLEIRASKAHPKPVFVILEQDKYKIYDLRSHRKSIYARLALRILNYVSHNPQRYTVTWEEALDLDLKASRDLDPPVDERLVRLIQLVGLGQLHCARTRVPLSIVHPGDFDFCMSFPLDVVRRTAREIEKGIESHLLVYWNEDELIMSDDYPVYLAYRSLRFEDVPVVIIGEFPKITIYSTPQNQDQKSVNLRW